MFRGIRVNIQRMMLVLLPFVVVGMCCLCCLLCALQMIHLTTVFVRSTPLLSPQPSQASICQLAHSSGGDGPVHGPALRGPEQVQSALEAQLQEGLQRRGQQNLLGRSAGVELLLSEQEGWRERTSTAPLSSNWCESDDASQEENKAHCVTCPIEVDHNSWFSVRVVSVVCVWSGVFKP